MSETTWYEVVIVVTYLLGCELVLVKEGRGREEKHDEVDIMVPTCSPLFFLPFFGFTNTFFGHHDKLW